MVEDAGLDAGDGGHARDAGEEHIDGDQDGVLRRQQEHAQRQGQCEQGAAHGAHRPVGEPSTEHGAHGHSGPGQGQQCGGRRRGVAADLGHQGLDVGVERGSAGEAEHHHGVGEPHLRSFEYAEFTADGASAGFLLHGDQGRQGDESQQTDARHDDERPAPADRLSEQGAQRRADDVGHRHTDQYHRKGSAAFFGRDEPGCDNGADSEEHTVRKPRHKACRQQQFMARDKG